MVLHIRFKVLIALRLRENFSCWDGNANRPG